MGCGPLSVVPDPGKSPGHNPWRHGLGNETYPCMRWSSPSEGPRRAWSPSWPSCRINLADLYSYSLGLLIKTN